MKRLQQIYPSLKGQEEVISMTELRKLPGEVFAQVALGKVFHVTKAGKVVGTISPREPTAQELGAALRAREERLKL